MAKRATDRLAEVKLTDLVEALRQDLEKAARARTAAFRPLFAVETVTVESEVTLKHTVDAKGSVSIYFSSLGASGSRASGSRAKIAVTLKALPPAGANSPAMLGSRRRKRRPLR
jgi:hypothetical protein